MKTTTLSILLATFLLLRSQIAADGGEDGAASRELSLAEVTRRVLEDNPAIKEAENRWYAAIHRVRQAYAWDDPHVAGESRMRRSRLSPRQITASCRRRGGIWSAICLTRSRN